MNRSNHTGRGRNEAAEFGVMLLLGIPGLVLLLAGLRALEAAGGFAARPAVFISAGGFLMAACGLYYFARDFASLGKKKGIAAFLAISVTSVLAALLVAGLSGAF